MSASFPYWHGISPPGYYFITELGKKHRINRKKPIAMVCSLLQAVTEHFPSQHSVSQQAFPGQLPRQALLHPHHGLLRPPQLLPRLTPTYARKSVSKK